MTPTAAERDAVTAARALIAGRAVPPWQTVAAVVLTASGARHLALNLDCTLGRAGVCAEPIAIGMAVTADPRDPIVFSAAVVDGGAVLPPCGVCREVLMDYGRAARIALPEGAEFTCQPIGALMPCAYAAEERRP